MILAYPGNPSLNRETVNDYFKSEPVLWLSGEDLKKSPKAIMEEASSGARSGNEETGVIPAGEDALIYIDGKSREEVEEILKTFPEQPGVRLHMAVHTENNENWPIDQLRKELERESLYFEKRKRLEELIRQADRKRLEAEPNYLRAVGSCIDLLEQPELPERLLDMAIEMLDAANRNV